MYSQLDCTSAMMRRLKVNYMEGYIYQIVLGLCVYLGVWVVGPVVV
jgi:hypothetical protein